MNEVQKAIEEITYMSEKFPEEAFRIIISNKEEAIPYLREAVDCAISKGVELDVDKQLHFYALYLLGEFQDRAYFSKIMELVSLPGDTVDYLIGDCVTMELKDILYNTYDGDIALLKESIQNRDINEFVRSAMLDVMGQLFLDGTLEESEWKEFLKENVHDGREYDYIYNEIGYILCQCHFIDMLPEIRYMFNNDLLDETSMGKYDSYVDAMFNYQENERSFCMTSFNAADTLRSCAMFSESEYKVPGEKDFSKMMCTLEKEWNQPVQKKKIGRNDLCPCGSGKKYKYCCLKKPQDSIDLIESPAERRKWLNRYPYTGSERIDGRIYLADYFDEESIETDKILYLALMHRPGLIWRRNIEAEEKRTKEYLYIAFQKCMERMEKEQIPSFAEYDEKYSIHYRCEEWVGELCRLLQENNDIERYKKVKKFVSGNGISIRQ
ncbi:MAG: DUF1186 domain-containing protein [Lachnospiraceae bacterium]|nr:DUF1186 domain-containing protein [Lachnospiraceae bacterium]